MASSSEWISELARAPATVSDQPGWVAAFASESRDASTGFRDISPFAPPEPLTAPVAEPVIPEPKTEALDKDNPATLEFQRGYAEGLAEAQRQGDAALAEERARFRELRFAFRALDAAALDALAQDLSATVLELCKPVLRDYALDQEALVQRCEAAAKRLGAGPGELTLRLHPETLARLDAAALPGWTLAEDTSLAPGALTVIGPDGTVCDGPEDWTRAIAEGLNG